MNNPHQITRDFEAGLCRYTGARFAVAVTSCTMALLLAVRWCVRANWEHAEACEKLAYWERPRVILPKRTYVGVPQSVIHAGARPVFENIEWRGSYQLAPYPVIDSARRFTSGMYQPGTLTCLSFHSSKILADTQGGAILHDEPLADAWFRRMRFDGRTEGVPANEDHIREVGYHCYLSPDVSARLLWKLSTLPAHNDDLPNSDYADLSLMEGFR